MSEVRHDSTSSLQRKKPPWLKLDIPVPAPMPEEPQPVQVPRGWGQEGGSAEPWRGCTGTPVLRAACACHLQQTWVGERQDVMAGHEAM